MNLLRQTPFPLTVSYSGLTATTDYNMRIYSDNSTLLYSYDVTSDGNGVVSKDLDQYFEKFDSTYALYIYALDGDGEPDTTEVIDTLTIKRPYINPLDLGSTEQEDQSYTNHERLARAIIDSITGGFYYYDDTIEIQGKGGDYLVVPGRINRLNYVYRNNQKVYDRFAPEDTVQDIYFVTSDHTAITVQEEGLYNRSLGKPVDLPLAASDSFNLYNDSDDPIAALTKVREFDVFPKDYDFIITGEFGWPVVPLDIQEATRLLIDDISCNKLQHVSKYIKEYKTDQFTIKYEDMAWKGTGNMMVDSILSGYQTNFDKLGVL